MLRKTVVAVALIGAGCSATGEQLYVSTASSLTGPFSVIEASFEATHPGTDVVLNIGGSTMLGQQISEGAPIDVFASADPSALPEGLGGATLFAVNRIQIVVPKGNPAGITGIESFADDTLFLGACAAAVPCGRLAEAVLSEAGVEPKFATREPNVKALLDKVALGELDAGLVYKTDVSPDVEVIAVESDLSNSYLIVAVTDRPASAAFVEFVVSDVGLAILSDWGFGAP